MSEERSKNPYLIAFIGFLCLVLLFIAAPSIKSAYESWRTDVKQAGDDENYETRKKVEDTARSMIASYKADVLTYETYIESEDKEEQSWAKQAKIRANKTAVSYNEYILENEFIWKDNIPEDIDYELPILE